VRPAPANPPGIDLIAERIESEGMVVDLLDCGVRFGQGFVFSPPRPVRAEALQGIGERGELTARESVEEAPPAPQPAAPARAPVATRRGRRGTPRLGPEPDRAAHLMWRRRSSMDGRRL